LKEPLEYLRHILNECDYLVRRSGSMSLEGLLVDEDMQRAFTRSLQVIGDATKMIPEEFRKKHPEVEWKKMTGMRDVIVHDYLGVDYKIVWDVIINYIPSVREKLLNILK